MNRILTTTAAVALIAGAAHAQTAAKPAADPVAAESKDKATAAPATTDATAASGAKVVAAGDIVATAKASGQF
ncbi:MAG: hypothetical protein Q7U11_18440, partial [Phenylobacterium sp.]|nr:hypothetical protein [Phenylobacterium sp.]